MRVVAISRVRNEADIVEAFVRHTLASCGAMIVMDHGSTDATGAILDKLQKEGLALHVIRDATAGNVQVDQMNRLLRIAAHEHGADWIFCLDADEFISGTADLSFLPPTVDETTRYLKLRMRTYYSRADDDEKVLNPVERITNRLIREPVEIYKVIIPGPMARQPESYAVQGCHRFMLATREAPFDVLQDAHLAHYSLRNPNQYATKVATAYLQNLRRLSSRGCEAWHYKAAYDKLRKSYSAFERDFRAHPLTYLPVHDVSETVADPLRYLGGPLQYTSETGHVDEFVERLLAIAEALAEPLQPRHEAAEIAPSGEYPTLSVEAFAEPGAGGSEVLRVPGDPAIVHSLVFDLRCTSETEELRICFGCDPGLLEIGEITLRYEGNLQAERTYGFAELKTMLRVNQNGATAHSPHVHRIFISSEPVIVAFRNWRRGDEPKPKSMDIKVRYRSRLLEGIFLHSHVLGEITRERAEHEALRGRARYAVGTDIDFSDEGTLSFICAKAGAIVSNGERGRRERRR